MADSATYTPETLQRRYAMAQALLADPKKPITHWAEGLNELAKGALGGYQMGNTERLEAKQRGDANAQVMAALGLGGPSASAPLSVGPPSAGPTPAAPTGGPAPAPQVLGAGGAPASPDAQGVYGADATMMPPGGGAAPPDFGKAIAGIESAGQKDPYAALGPTTRTGDRAYGKYQVMGANIPAWTKEHLGQEMTPEQFLQNPQAQDAVFKGQFGKYVQQTGNPQDAASMWFSGKPLAQGAGLKDQLGTSGQQYVDKFNAGMGGPAGASPAVGAIASALNGGATGASAPAAGAPPNPAVADVAKTLSAPAGAPGGAPLAGPAGVGANPNAKAIAAVLTSPWIDPSVKQAVIAQSSPSFGFQTLPDGTIIRTNPKTGQVEPVYQAATKPTFGQTGESAFGDKQFGFIDPVAKTITPANGAQAGGGVAGVPDSGFMAKGVTAIDHELKGSDYLNQFSPEVKAAVQNMVDGNSMPTGNPRKGFTQAVKMIAQKYGSDTGIPMDDASFGQRRQMLNNLAVSTPGSLGGQINFAGTSLEHLATTAEKIGELNNVNGLGIAPIAKLANAARQLTTEQAGKANAVTGAAQHYGQEVTKFYSGSPGGEAERSRFMNTLSTSKSPIELADALQTERDLIPGRLEQLSTQIKTTFGENSAQAQKYLGRIEEAKKAVPRIDAAIGKLRGEGAPAPAAQPGTAPAAATPKAPAAGEVRSGYRFKGGDPANKANWEQVI